MTDDVRLDSVGDTGDTCSLDRFILLWRELLINHFVKSSNFSTENELCCFEDWTLSLMRLVFP